ncbi:hypothetical protein [Desulfoscipio gibsoniae]|nr:hypothetical protein [Desulfoscipio gibsoniae]
MPRGSFISTFQANTHMRTAILERSMDAIVEASFESENPTWDPMVKSSMA